MPTPPAHRSPIRRSDHWELPLTQGKVAIVDLDCPTSILERTWFARRVRRIHGDDVFYATFGEKTANGIRIIYLHRELLGLSRHDRTLVDHEDGDGLNNRRSNVRTCSSLQNNRNKQPRRHSSSRFYGVSWNSAQRQWVARVRWTDAGGHRRSTSIGVFRGEAEAAMAYDVHAPAIVSFDQLPFLRRNFPVKVGTVCPSQISSI